jgi:hypothetical protein
MATPRGNLDTVWTLSLTETSQDKHANRVGVQTPASHELVGVDGLSEGGLSPFPGFRRVHEFDKTGWNTAVGSSVHDGSSRIIDCFPVNFLVGDDGYAYGFVYRVRRKGVNSTTASTVADVFCDFYSTKAATGGPKWSRSNLVMSNVPVSPIENSVTGKQMSVAVYGRYVYVFVEGQSPVAIYTKRTTPWDFKKLTSPGPGLKPQFVSPEQNPTGVMGALTTYVEGGNTYPSRAILHLDADLPFSETLATPYYSAGTYPDLSTDCHPIDAGDYAFAYVLYDSTSGRRSALSQIAQVRHNTDPSAGSDFDDPATPTVLDGAPLYAFIEVCYDHTKFDQMYIYRSVQVQRAGGTYIASILHLERVINLADYHTLNTDLGVPIAQAMYVYMLEDKQLVYQDVFADYSAFDEQMPKAGMAAMYEGTLLCAGQDASVSSSSSIEIRPGDTQIGVGELRWSSLSYPSPELFPPSNRYVPAVQSDSIVAVCQVGANAIGFSSGRQYHIRKEAGTIKIQPIHAGYGIVNPRAVTDIGTLAYFVTSKGVQAVDTMGALDNVKSINNLIIERWKDYHHEICVSCDSEISAFFVMVPSLGEMAVFWMSSAAVTEVHDLPFTLTCRGVWPKVFTFSQTNLASNEGELNTTYLNDLVDRAFFIQNPCLDTEVDIVPGASWFVHVVDNKRERLQVGGTGNGQRQSTLIEYGGDSIFPVDSWFDTNQLTVSRGPSNALNPGDDVNGLYMYVLNAQNKAMIGKKVRIKERYDPVTSTTATYIIEENDTQALLYSGGLVAGDVIGISPVKFRWVGAPIIPQSEEGDQMASSANFFVVKHIKSVTGSFVGVSGTALTYTDSSVVRYSGLVYPGISETAYRAETLDHNGNLILSIEDNNPYWAAAFGDTTTGSGKFGIDGAVLTPGIEVIVPNLSYTLIGALVSGAMRPTYRAGAM